AVVDYGDFAGGYLLADEAGEGGGLLAVEVGFEAVADSFVEEDAGPAGAEDDLHLTGRSVDCAKLEDGGAGGLAGEVLGRLVWLTRAARGEEVYGDAASTAARAAGGAAGAPVSSGVVG